MNNLEDTELVRLVLEKNLDAFEVLMYRHKSLVYHLCYRLLRNKQDAEEMAQDSFVKVFQKLDTFQGDSKFSTWLYTITYRTCLNKLGKKEIQTNDYSESEYELSIDGDWLNILNGLDQANKFAELHLLLEKLKLEERALLTFFYFDELSIKEIAQINGWNESKVKVGLFRARTSLKKLIESNVLMNELTDYGKA